MKTKIDFITNSSSSSFIISKSKDCEIGKIKITMDVDPRRMDLRILKTKEELIEEFWEHHPQMGEMIKEIEEGREIVTFSCSTESDDPLETFLCYEGIEESNFENKDIKVIWGEGGY